MTRIDERAVVLGASMAGLLAARVLADYYTTVTVVERDTLPLDVAQRRGVPQGRHVHLLLPRGSQVLGQLFPGLLDELAADGATVVDEGSLARESLTFGGHELDRSGAFADPASWTHYISTRPFLEGHVRRRLRAIPNVTLLDGHDVVALIASHPHRVTGARVADHGTGEELVLEADLVVDATGRGSRTPVFLEGLGYGRPRVDSVAPQLAYASQLLSVPSGTLTEKFIIIGPVPERPTGGALMRCENDKWVLTLAGMAGSEPPVEQAEMIQFAQEFAPAAMIAAMRAADPLSEVARFRYPLTQWQRYDKMRRFPSGLLTLGDAVCSFNPIYGQGMTVAAVEAAVLRECLRAGDRDLSKRFFRAVAKPIGTAWQLARSADLALPGVPGRRPLSVRLMNRYIDRVLTAAESDALVAERFARVSGLLDAPASLVHPSVMHRAAMARRRQRTDRVTQSLPDTNVRAKPVTQAKEVSS